MGTLLNDVVIVDLSTVVSGPFAVRMLTDQGAQVIKVEAPGLGDVARYMGSNRNGVSAMYATCNHGKDIRTIDLKTSDGLDEVLELLDSADMVVQNFRPGAMARMGLGWDTLHARNPELICLSISGFGPKGPMAGFRVYDPIIQAAAGICDSQIDPSTGGPFLFQGVLVDKVTSLYAAQAAFAALLDRAQQRLATGTSEGTHVEVSMFDSALHFLWPDGMYNHTFTQADGVDTWPDYSAFYRLSTAGGGHLAYSVVSDDEMTGALRALGLDHLFDDPRFGSRGERVTRRDELLEMIEAAVNASPDLDALLDALWAYDVPASRVEDRAGLATHPQVIANNSMQIVDFQPTGPLHQAAPVFTVGD